MFSLSHIIRMTDKIGILEHCKYSTPDPLEGYTVDDNARALQLMLRLYHINPEAPRLASIYANFLFDCVTPDGFHNNRDAQGQWIPDGWLGDWYGRAMLAFADAVIFGPADMRKKSLDILCRSYALATRIDSVRTEALLLEAGYRFWMGTTDNRDFIINWVTHAADRLVAAYRAHTDASWHWFEDRLTYENARLPEALLCAYEVTKNKEYREVGQKSLDFLIDQTCDAKKGVFSFIGNNGWYPRGGSKPIFGQQPVEAAATVEALATAYRVTKDETYQSLAHTAFDWYSGNNVYGASLLDKKTGGVLDGLEEYGVSKNEGAESVITYGLASCALKDIV